MPASFALVTSRGVSFVFDRRRVVHHALFRPRQPPCSRKLRLHHAGSLCAFKHLDARQMREMVKLTYPAAGPKPEKHIEYPPKGSPAYGGKEQQR
jgi:hypothetical protein